MPKLQSPLVRFEQLCGNEDRLFLRHRTVGQAHFHSDKWGTSKRPGRMQGMRQSGKSSTGLISRTKIDWSDFVKISKANWYGVSDDGQRGDN